MFKNENSALSNITVSINHYNQICEAYEVLSDFKARTLYDTYGVEALSRGPYSKRESSFPGYEYNEIFDDKGKDLYGSCFGYAFGGILNKRDTPNMDHIHVGLNVTLEELYNGCIKEVTADSAFLLNRHEETIVTQDEPKITYTKSSSDVNTHIGHFEEPIRVEIKPGYTDGHEILVQNTSKPDSEGPKGLLVVHLYQQTHAKYTRKGNDLVYKHDIKLLDALNASPVKFQTLDGRTLNISVDHIINPQSAKAVENEGMPIYSLDEEVAKVT